MPEPPEPTRGSGAAGRIPWSAGVAGLVALAVAATFLPTLGNDFVLWDDDLILTENPHYRGLGAAHLRWMVTTFHGGHYQPLTWLSFALDHALWGMDPRGYHLTSLALHVVNAVLVSRLIAVLVPWAGTQAVVLGTLLFAVHPLRVEAVAWATARRDVLAATFYLLALLAYLRAVAPHGGRAGRWRLASLGCFALSLLAKTQGMTLPLVLLALDVYPLRRLGSRADAGRLVREKLAYLALGVAAAAVAFAGSTQVMRRTLAQHGLLERAAQAGFGLVFYLGKTLLPVGLAPIHPLGGAGVDVGDARFLGALALVVALTVGLAVLRTRAPWALTAWVCYVVVLAPVLGFAQAGPQLVADRYSYLAVVPWVVLATAGLARLRVPAVRVLATGAIAVLAVLAVRQIRVWHDSRTFWDTAIRFDARNDVAWVNRGKVRELAGDVDGAYADYDAAATINPSNFIARYNRGRFRHMRGDLAGAIDDYSATLAIRPDYAEAYNNRATARVARDDFEGAAADLARALSIVPPDWGGRARLAANLAIVEEAIRTRAGRPPAADAPAATGPP